MLWVCNTIGKAVQGCSYTALFPMPTPPPQLQGSEEGRRLLAVLREGQVDCTCRYCEISQLDPVSQSSFWGTYQVLGERRKRFLWDAGGKCHMEGGNTSVKCSILSLAGPKGAKRGMRLEQVYLVPRLQFPSFQALRKADVVSAWVVLLHLASPTCLSGQLSIFYLYVHTYQWGIHAQPCYWTNWWIKLLLQPHLYPVTEFGNCDTGITRNLDTFLTSCRTEAITDFRFSNSEGYS